MAWQYAHRRDHAGVVHTVLLDVTGLVVEEVDWDWRDAFLGKFPNEEGKALDVAIFPDGFEDLPHTSYLLLTEAAVRAVRVVEEEFVQQYCAVSGEFGCMGTYQSENEAFDELQWPEDRVVRATECPDGHLVEWDERDSPPPPPSCP